MLTSANMDFLPVVTDWHAQEKLWTMVPDASESKSSNAVSPVSATTTSTNLNPSELSTPAPSGFWEKMANTTLNYLHSADKQTLGASAKTMVEATQNPRATFSSLSSECQETMLRHFLQVGGKMYSQLGFTSHLNEGHMQDILVSHKDEAMSAEAARLWRCSRE